MNLKFHFNLTTQTLKLVKENRFLVIPPEWKFPYFRSLVFTLNPDQPEHRIIFSVGQEKIQALYKIPQDGSVVYYKREIIRPASGVIEVEFTEWDKIKNA